MHRRCSSRQFHAPDRLQGAWSRNSSCIDLGTVTQYTGFHTERARKGVCGGCYIPRGAEPPAAPVPPFDWSLLAIFVSVTDSTGARVIAGLRTWARRIPQHVRIVYIVYDGKLSSRAVREIHAFRSGEARIVAYDEAEVLHEGACTQVARLAFRMPGNGGPPKYVLLFRDSTVPVVPNLSALLAGLHRITPDTEPLMFGRAACETGSEGRNEQLVACRPSGLVLGLNRAALESYVRHAEGGLCEDSMIMRGADRPGERGLSILTMSHCLSHSAGLALVTSDGFLPQNPVSYFEQSHSHMGSQIGAHPLSFNLLASSGALFLDLYMYGDSSNGMELRRDLTFSKRDSNMQELLRRCSRTGSHLMVCNLTSHRAVY